METNWRNKSIELLEQHNYGDAAATDIPIVKRILEMVKLPVGNLDIEQLRLLIGQEIGLIYLIPLALVYLENDIMTEGDYYPGDLLQNILTVDSAFWVANPRLHTDVKNLIHKNRYLLDTSDIDISDFPNL